MKTMCTFLGLFHMFETFLQMYSVTFLYFCVSELFYIGLVHISIKNLQCSPMWELFQLVNTSKYLQRPYQVIFWFCIVPSCLKKPYYFLPSKRRLRSGTTFGEFRNIQLRELFLGMKAKTLFKSTYSIYCLVCIRFCE